MEKKKHKFAMYRVRLVQRQRSLFGELLYTDRWDALSKVMDEDFTEKKVFRFEHPAINGIKYRRHYIYKVLNGRAILKVGPFRNNKDYALVAINLHSHFYDEPYVVLGNWSPAFNNKNQLAAILKLAFNWALADSGLEVDLELCNTSERKIKWGIDLIYSFLDGTMECPEEDMNEVGFEAIGRVIKIINGELVEKKKAPNKKKPIKSDHIEDYIIRGDKAQILKALHKELKGLTTAIDIARPVKYLCKNKVFYDINEYRLPYKAFIKEFAEVKDYISDSRYNTLISQGDTTYEGDPKCDMMETIFDFII